MTPCRHAFFSDSFSLPKMETKRNDALNLFREMARTRPLPSTIHFTKLLSRVMKMKHYSIVVSLFQEMRIRGIPIGVYTLNILIDAFRCSDRVDCGFCVLGLFFKCGIEFDDITFNTLLKGLCQDHKIVEVVELFRKSVRENLYTLNTFNILIDACCRANRVDCGFCVLGMLFKRGIEFDVITFNTLINGLCLDNKIAEAVELFKKLVRENMCEIDHITYGTLISGLCKAGHAQTALDLLTQMPNEGPKPNTIGYNTLIKGLCLDNKFVEAVQLFRELVRDNACKIDEVTYCTLISMLCRAGYTQNALDLLRVMQKEGPKPNTRAYNIVIDALCKEGMVDEALNLLSEMNGSGVPRISSHTLH
nr:pentatricopeptide repeat-containing protein At3g22470, mitochondrial-like [Ipomoea trifida]